MCFVLTAGILLLRDFPCLTTRTPKPRESESGQKSEMKRFAGQCREGLYLESFASKGGNWTRAASEQNQPEGDAIIIHFYSHTVVIAKERPSRRFHTWG